MAVEHVKTAEFNEKIAQGKVLVDFFADWCGPCKMMAPGIESFADEHPEVAVYKVNVDEEPELAIRYKVMSIPTLVVFQDGEKVNQSVGLISKDELNVLVLG